MSGPDWSLRPARDHGLSPDERLRSQGRERGLGSLVTGSVWRFAVRAYLTVFHQLRVVGIEHVPAPPFVMIANHSSHLDALTLAAALPWSAARHAFALAAGDTFFTSTPASVFAAYAVNALPVWRARTTAADLLGLRARLMEDGVVYILFPEGTRSRTGEIGPFKPGIAALVAGTAVPVVPCYLHGAAAAWPAGRTMPRPGRLQLRIGPPLNFSGAASDRAGGQAVADACREAVVALRTDDAIGLL